MYWPPLQPKMLVTTLLLSPQNQSQQFVNDCCSSNLNNQTAVQRHSSMISVVAAVIGKHDTDNIATTFYKWASTEHQ